MTGIGAFARDSPGVPAIVAMGTSISFGELDDRQRRLAGALKEGGVGEGDRIGVLSSNRPESLEVTAGALRAGIVPVPINPLLTSAEIAFLLEDVGARWLLTDRATERDPDVERIITFGDAYERVLHEATPADLSDVTLGRPMHYTSGTTGQPKGVWAAPQSVPDATRTADGFIDLWNLRPDDLHLVCSPLPHSAPHRFAVRTLEAGGTVVLQQRFEAEETLATIDLLGITTTFMVPTHLERILALGHSERRATTFLRCDSLRTRALPYERTPNAGSSISFPPGSVWEFYGSTGGRRHSHLTERMADQAGQRGAAGSVGDVTITR